jgi:hypothetical protein
MTQVSNPNPGHVVTKLYGRVEAPVESDIFKGTVLPGITFYFRFCKIKSVLAVRLLMVSNLCDFLVL